MILERGGGVRISVKLLKHLWFARIRATVFFLNFIKFGCPQKRGWGLTPWTPRPPPPGSAPAFCSPEALDGGSPLSPVDFQ